MRRFLRTVWLFFWDPLRLQAERLDAQLERRRASGHRD